MPENILVALIGLGGVLVGVCVQVLFLYMQGKPQRNLDSARKELLEKMMNDQRFPDGWRNLDILSRVIGTEHETTKKLLIELNCRGSEKEKEMWGYISRHPFSEIDHNKISK